MRKVRRTELQLGMTIWMANVFRDQSGIPQTAAPSDPLPKPTRGSRLGLGRHAGGLAAEADERQRGRRRRTTAVCSLRDNPGPRCVLCQICLPRGREVTHKREDQATAGKEIHVLSDMKKRGKHNAKRALDLHVWMCLWLAGSARRWSPGLAGPEVAGEVEGHVRHKAELCVAAVDGAVHGGTPGRQLPLLRGR